MLSTLKKYAILMIIMLTPLLSYADEGLWIPSLLEHYNIENMHEKGLRLSAEDIYSINQASLTDGVVIFGGGCTGAVISANGLVITNHHCAFGSIQSLSSIEKDYLTHGFWAMGMDEELPAPGLSVLFLMRIEDVTASVLEGVSDEMVEASRKDKIDSNIRKIIDEAVKGTHYNAIIKPFYYGNEFYMFIYEEYKDLRLVGAPPSSIGNFGADPDNWMWPRHTGDFSLFRIYAGSDNKPASYSEDNIPWQSRKVLSISTAGYKENDFTMLLGYPGTTNQYLISPGMEMVHKNSLVHKIKLRDKRLEVMDKYMSDSDVIRLQYASKYRNVSNAWKKWQGVLRGLDRVDGMGIKRKEEEEFSRWVASDDTRNREYGRILPEMYRLYSELGNYSLIYDYGQECIMATEIFSLFFKLGGFITENKNDSEPQKRVVKERFLLEVTRFFKDYHMPLDIEIFAAMLRFYFEDINEKFHPAIYTEIHGKYKGNYEKYAKAIFQKSKLVSLERVTNLFKPYPANEEKIKMEILNDPLYQVFASFSRIYNEEVYGIYEYVYDEIEKYYRIYVQKLREMQTERVFYPDANFTMRLTYGKVEGYEPADAIVYHFQTSIDGKIKKNKTGLPDYRLSEKMLELYSRRDFGRWADQDGNLYTCFIASNHTTGGNSGSPVMNADGQIIGINFDRNWEGTMNDYIYDPLQCRNISVDIRYILFIIDKYADAGHLIQEMEIVN